MCAHKIMAKESSQELRTKATRWVFDYLDNLPIGIYRSTVEGKFVYCNQSISRMFGFDSVEETMAFPVVDLYWDKKDRGNLIRSVMERGRAEEIILPFKTRKGDPIWCAVTVHPVFDDDGIMIYLDGVIRDITEHVEGMGPGVQLDDTVNTINDMVIILDLDGTILDINRSGSQLLGARKADLVDMELSQFILEKDRGLFPVFLSEIRRSGRKDAILAIVDLSKREHFIEFHAFLVSGGGNQDHIRGVARDITNQVRRQSEELIRERFQGVLEMAGGIAHQLNQPLTVVNHLILETMREVPAESPLHERIKRVHAQIQKINEIALKIRGINRYEAMDYVGGLKIVDLDKAS